MFKTLSPARFLTETSQIMQNAEKRMHFIQTSLDKDNGSHGTAQNQFFIARFCYTKTVFYRAEDVQSKLLLPFIYN